MMRSPPDRAVWVRALAGDIVWCWARHLTFTVPPLTQVYKWVLLNLMLGANLQWTSIPSRGGVKIILVALCPDEPLEYLTSFLQHGG